MKRCHYCGPTDEELRPYGPGGSLICFPCMKADPERERAAAGRYMALLDATSTLGLTAIGTEAGPINVDPAELGLITPAVIPPHTYECALVASDGNAPCDCRVTSAAAPAVLPPTPTAGSNSGGGDTA